MMPRRGGYEIAPRDEIALPCDVERYTMRCDVCGWRGLPDRRPVVCPDCGDHAHLYPERDELRPRGARLRCAAVDRVGTTRTGAAYRAT